MIIRKRGVSEDLFLLNCVEQLNLTGRYQQFTRLHLKITGVPRELRGTHSALCVDATRQMGLSPQEQGPRR